MSSRSAATKRSEISRAETPLSFARRMIRSSTSVKFRTNVTRYPLDRRYRRSTSKTSAERAWPMCEKSYTVTAQTYIRISPEASGTSSSLVRVSVL